MSTLVLPICGKSTRYPGTAPKWSLEFKNRTMLELSIAGLSGYDKIVVIMLEKHKHYPTLKTPHKKIIINESNNQLETIYKGIQKGNIKGPIAIKDCDNYFRCTITPDNFVTYSYLCGKIHNAENKSYIEFDKHNKLINIVEKQVISHTFSCGMYGFSDTSLFCDYYNKQDEFLSDMIFKMILDSIIFFAKPSSQYIDWGTLQNWNEFLKENKNDRI